MNLRQKQSRFAHMVALLILHAEQIGYFVTFGDAYRDPLSAGYGHPQSLHGKRLAVDLNLFDDEGRWLRETADHLPLGLYWESIGGSWGGRFEDGNHYSLEHDGVR